MPEKILIICAHNDDHILGLGGTIANYLKEGKLPQPDAKLNSDGIKVFT